jgi:hypothetical protein
MEFKTTIRTSTGEETKHYEGASRFDVYDQVEKEGAEVVSLVEVKKGSHSFVASQFSIWIGT